MTIVLLVEGKTEKALKEKLKTFLDQRTQNEGFPKVALRTKEIMTLNESRLHKRIQLELSDPNVKAVVGLIDVYPDFASAAKAKAFLRRIAGDEPRFYAHAAQYDVEAWLLPYWEAICQRIGVRQVPPGPHPEQVNHNNPPSKRLAALYQRARQPRKYKKAIEMEAILRDKDLTIAAKSCPELKALLNTLLKLADLRLLP